MVEHEITSVANGEARSLKFFAGLLIATGIAFLVGLVGNGWAAFPLGCGMIGAGLFGLLRLALDARTFKLAGAAMVVIALLLLLDASPQLYPEKMPSSVKPPLRTLFDRDPLIAGILPNPLLAALVGAGLFGLWAVIDHLSLFVSRILMAVVAVIVSIMFYEVFVRYVMNAPTLWVNEMSLWFAGGVYLLASLYVLQQRAHIRIFILYDIVPRWLQRIFDAFSTLLILFFAFAITYGGFKESWRKLLRWETFGTAWDPPIPATIKPLILLTLLLIAFQALSNLICDWGREKETHDLSDEVAEDVKDIIEEQRAV